MTYGAIGPELVSVEGVVENDSALDGGVVGATGTVNGEDEREPITPTEFNIGGGEPGRIGEKGRTTSSNSGFG